MKTKAVILSALALILVGGSVYAEPDIEMSISYNISQSENIESGFGYEISGNIVEPMRLFFGYTKNMVRYAGQEAYDVELLTAGLKLEYEIVNGINLILGASYNLPNVKLRKPHVEALSRELNRIVISDNPTTPEDSYTCDLNPDIGGLIALKFRYRKWAFNVGYSFLRLEETIICHAEQFGDGWWEVMKYRNHSKFSVGGTYIF